MSRIIKAERALLAPIEPQTELNPQFTSSIELITQRAMRKLTSFDKNSYHESAHAMNMRQLGRSLLERMQKWSKGELVTQRQLELYDAVAAAHDIIQPGNMPRRTARPESFPERESADWLLLQMASENNKFSPATKPFILADWHEAEEAIVTTKIQNEPFMYQPLLPKATSPITIALALYDLNCGGLIDGPSRSVNAIRRLFYEWKIPKEMRERLAKGTLTAGENASLTTALFDFVDKEIEFTKSRGQHIGEEIDGIEMLKKYPDVQKRLKAEFSHFGTSYNYLIEMKKTIEEARITGERKTFEQLFALVSPPKAA